MNLNDTIVAIATPHGRGAIGIVRFSGPKTMTILSSIFVSVRHSGEHSSHKLIRGDIHDHGKILDDVLISKMDKGKSYTGDALVEIHAHSNPLILNEMLKLIVSNGARLAEPGEFTFRAYMNGCMDLSQAEAVCDVIHASSIAALSVAQKQLKGEFSNKINYLRSSLVEMLVHTEASIDFSTEDIEVFSVTDMKDKLTPIKNKISFLLERYQQGRLVTEGIRVAIVGRPNVGKSSLLNALLNEERAIVTDIAGTTRDTIEESVEVDGMLIKFIDTAGIHKPKQEVERLGIQKTQDKIKQSDLVLLVLDASKKLNLQDHELIDQLLSRPLLIAINKQDKLNEADKSKFVEGLTKKYPVDCWVLVSALKREGIEGLKEKIHHIVLGRDFNADQVLLTKARHREALSSALKDLETFEKGLAEKKPLEFLALDLRNAVDALEQIIGQVSLENVYDQIFSSFCIGK